jgi:predicted RNA binding protein YcfA (HicA-like mRNA interferase family)
MPRKKRQLKQELRKAAFEQINDRGKGSHTVWKHRLLPDITVVLSGKDGEDADHYEERQVREAIAETKGQLS